MAAILHFVRKSDNSIVVGKALNELDVEICAALGVPVDDARYYAGWMDSIGMMFAFGRNFAYIRDNIVGYYYEKELELVLNYIEANFEDNLA